jgi:hypothetical protein
MNTGVRRALIMVVPTALLAGCIAAPPYPGTMVEPGIRKTTVVKTRPAAPDLVKTRKGHYKVRSPWTVELRNRRWQVQSGYTCNGITAPDGIKKSLGDGVKHPETWAAVFHDWLFTQPGITRAEADRLFYDLLIAYRVPETKARLMYSTVAAYSASKRFR